MVLTKTRDGVYCDELQGADSMYRLYTHVPGTLLTPEEETWNSIFVDGLRRGVVDLPTRCGEGVVSLPEAMVFAAARRKGRDIALPTCPTCHVLVTMGELWCDNDCGTGVCAGCGKQNFYETNDGRIYLGHAPKCGIMSVDVSLTDIETD